MLADKSGLRKKEKPKEVNILKASGKSDEQLRLEFAKRFGIGVDTLTDEEKAEMVRQQLNKGKDGR